MLLLIVFAFIAGFVTILSPCILPILPIVLSGTVGGGKKRPFGIVTGFIASFTFFTLFLTAIVQATGISADILRNISVVIVLLFGISLLLPQFQVLVEKLFSKLASKMPQQTTQSGFLGGLLIGISLGLIWTPCVGPILASVISLALTGSVTGSAALITLAYSLGTAIPMFAIIYGGRALLQKMPWLLRNTGKIQKAFGILMIITAIGIYFQIDRRFQTWVLETFPSYGTGLTQFEDNDQVIEQLDNLDESNDSSDIDLESSNFPNAPEIIAGGQWFNSEPVTIESLKGKVVLIDFWTYSCINCIRTLPYLRDWHEKYKDKGLVIIGVHTPEFEFEKDPENVEEAIKDFGLLYPIVQDNNYATWQAYSNRYWPAKYFIDKNGKVRSTHFGEGEYDESEKLIQELLSENGQPISMPISNPDYEIESGTPELYLGYNRIEYLANNNHLKRDQEAFYTSPQVINPNYFSYQGKWFVSSEFAQPSAGGVLTLNFNAKEVFLVMRSTDGTPGIVSILLDGKPVTVQTAGEDVIDGKVKVDKDRLYKLVELQESGTHILKLNFDTGNIEIFAFTFG